MACNLRAACSRENCLSSATEDSHTHATAVVRYTSTARSHRLYNHFIVACRVISFPFIFLTMASSSRNKQLEPLRLDLTTTSLTNCIISNASDAVFFEVVTPKWTPNMTKISRRDPNTRELEVIAELENTDKGYNVRLRGGQFRPTKEFLKKDKDSKSEW